MQDNTTCAKAIGISLGYDRIRSGSPSFVSAHHLLLRKKGRACSFSCDPQRVCGPRQSALIEYGPRTMAMLTRILWHICARGARASLLIDLVSHTKARSMYTHSTEGSLRCVVAHASHALLARDGFGRTGISSQILQRYRRTSQGVALVLLSCISFDRTVASKS